MHVTPLGLYLRVFEIEEILNLEKKTSSILSVLLLMYDCIFQVALSLWQKLKHLVRNFFLLHNSVNFHLYPTWGFKMFDPT